VTKLVHQGSHRFPQFLPDGRHFIFFAQTNPDAQGIYLASLDGSDAKRLLAAETAGAYIQPGLLIFNRQGALVARRLDITGGTLTGETMTLAESVSYDISFNMGGFAVSSEGRMAYRAVALEARQLQWFDRNGKPLGVAGEPDVNNLACVELSPNGRQLAVQRTIQNNIDVWLIDVLRGGPKRFTVDAAADQKPIWSPDGVQIAFSSNRKGIYDLYLKLSSGAGAEELLLESQHTKTVQDWSADRRFVLYQEAGSTTGWDLWALPMVGDRKPMAVVNSPFEERNGQFSPDGRWVAYQSNVTGRFEIYVQPFPGPGGNWKVSTAGGTFPRWRADGKELFFIAPDGKLMSVPVNTSGSTIETGSPMALFQTRIVTGGLANQEPQYAVSHDGRFLINNRVDQSTTTPITMILNWKPKL
jgi:Tol biopolymer transport system component